MHGLKHIGIRWYKGIPSFCNVGNFNQRAVLSNVSTEWSFTLDCNINSGFFLPSFLTSAFSAPTFTFSNGTLSAEAVRWFPKPSVSWLNQTENILNGSSTFTENSEGIFSIFSTLLSVQVSNTYSFRIENNLVMALSEATISGSLYTFTLTWYQTHLY